MRNWVTGILLSFLSQVICPRIMSHAVTISNAPLSPGKPGLNFEKWNPDNNLVSSIVIFSLPGLGSSFF